MKKYVILSKQAPTFTKKHCRLL